ADLAQNHPKPIDLAKNLRLDVSWQRASVSGSQFFQTFAAVLVQRIIVGDPLAKQQSSNAVRVLDARSRETRRQSSSLGLGGTVMAQTRGSPRCQSISVRSSVSPSIASVLARRWRRGTAIDAGSTTWLSTPLASSKRWIQKPSSPTSWIATTLTGAAMRCSARIFKRARRLSRLRPSPPTSVCLDILLLPGASAVATHVERLSSNETNKVAQSPRLQVRSETGRVVA